eukprot:gnl/MRDRNA2_/MRDRNA2_98415_c0_seq1.p1 gnl/MRDRNA2_/MRDRNA2_98415_c0~~gnl/MRDRNA2_/MRDRNA2_98415_c0_seq1.p1  ORF type:complete len:200 (+),score=18.66 gnl/MRDRNA2_/MRDRNA2_98415_c0_seq1:63-602(+)
MLVPLVIPIGRPPTEYALKMKPTLVGIVFAQGLVCASRFLLGDPWGGVSDGILFCVGYFATTELSMMYMVWFCFMSSFNLVFDIAYVIIRVLELKQGYFNLHMSFRFNAWSLLLLVAPIVAALSSAFSWRVYKDYFECTESEYTPLTRGEEEEPRTGYRLLLRDWHTFQPFVGRGHRLS